MDKILDIFKSAQVEARQYAFKTIGKDVMIYPCGFAWVYVKLRKNNPFGKQLESIGFQWDVFRKHYCYWVGEYNQSCSHKEAHAEKLAELLTKEFGMKFYHSSRLD